MKGTEEIGELAQAVLSYSHTCGCDYKGLTSNDIIEESIDGLLVLLSIIIQVSDYNFDEKSITKILNTKLNKWESKIKI